MIYLLPMVLAPDTQKEVITEHSIELIKNLKVFFVENVKTTRRFISSLKLGIVIDELEFIEINELKDITEVYNILINLTQDAGIISEAGCAGVADPGALIVEVAHQLNIRVVPLVGPNSILLALMASGLNGQSFVFHGYLPIAEGDRVQKLKILERDAKAKNQSQIFMETPYRNTQVFQTILKNLNLQTRLCIASNITANDEFIHTYSIQKWKTETHPDIHKKPTIFILA